MKILRKILEEIFYIIHPLFKPEPIQLFLSRHIALPYTMAKHLDFKGIVPFWVNGKKLFMRSYNTPIEITVFWRGIFSGREGAELSIWSKLSKGADVAFDIGANNGIYALVSSVHPNLKIHAFEPVPVVYYMLLENIELNQTKNIIPHQFVVSDSAGTQTLYVPQVGWADAASLNQDFAKKYSEGRELTKVQVESISLDEFLTRQGISNSKRIICKIDVEGAEPLILAGATETIRNRNIIFLIEALDTPAFDALKLYFPSEYEIYGVDTKNHKLFKTDISSDRANNYLFIKSVPLTFLEEIKL